MVSAVDKHLALIGFMGAGSRRSARRSRPQRPARSSTSTGDREPHRPVGELFERGEPEFRRIEEQIVAEALAGPDGGHRARGRGRPLGSDAKAVAEHRVQRMGDGRRRDGLVARPRLGRPLARDREQFGRLFDERAEMYDLLARGTERTRTPCCSSRSTSSSRASSRATQRWSQTSESPRCTSSK